jgi:c-di-GMP-related signal transduction protein
MTDSTMSWMAASWESTRFERSSINAVSCELMRAARRMRTKARMISMFALIAVLLRRTLESMATPCSVNTPGRYRLPP